MDYIWTRNFSKYGNLIKCVDDFVIICKKCENVKIAYKWVLYIIVKLELTPRKYKIKVISLWRGKESFDFLGYTNWKVKSKTRKVREYYALT